MEEEQIRLTPNILKVIGESTKIKILKELSLGPRVPSDISKKLNKSVPTILEHLEKLTNAGLVEKREQPGKKYVFYSLTPLGMELVTNRGKVSIVLYGSIFMFVIGISLFASLFGLGYYNNGISGYAPAVVISSAITPNTTIAANSALVNYQVLSILNLVAIVILVCAFLMLFVYVRKLGKINIRIGD